MCWAPLAHACNPSCSGELRFKASLANSSQDPISKVPIKKIKEKQRTALKIFK
jgi:hypothetical protein